MFNSDHISTYYLYIFLAVAQKMRIFANLWYLQNNGIEFFKVFYHYKVERKKSFYLLYTIWIFHILMPITILGYQYLNRREDYFPLVFIALMVLSYLSFSTVWSVSFLMWNVSVHVFESLANLKKILLKRIDENSSKSLSQRTKAAINSAWIRSRKFTIGKVPKTSCTLSRDRLAGS